MYISRRFWKSFPEEAIAMKLREIMTKNVVRIRPDEPVAVAARDASQAPS